MTASRRSSTARPASRGGPAARSSRSSPWGRRRLAYPIDGHREGSYHIILFDAPAERVAEMEHGLTITEEVMRHMVDPRRAPGGRPATRWRRRRRQPEEETCREWTRSSTSPRANCSTQPRARRPHPPSTGRGRPWPSARCMIIGNLGRDPEMRYTPSGQAGHPVHVRPPDRKYQQTRRVGRGDRVVPGQRLGPAGRAHAEQLCARVNRSSWRVASDPRVGEQDGHKRYPLELIANQVSRLERRPRDEDGPSG